MHHILVTAMAITDSGQNNKQSQMLYIKNRFPFYDTKQTTDGFC